MPESPETPKTPEAKPEALNPKPETLKHTLNRIPWLARAEAQQVSGLALGSLPSLGKKVFSEVSSTFSGLRLLASRTQSRLLFPFCRVWVPGKPLGTNMGTLLVPGGSCVLSRSFGGV